METKKARGGRPKKISQEDYETVKKLASVGLTMQLIADFLDISVRTCERDKEFCRVYKKAYTVLGAKVRTTLMAKIEKDTLANIYLDKIINKTTEKFHDDNIEIKKAQIELEKEKLELERLKNNLTKEEYEDDGFIEALQGSSENINYDDLGDTDD